MNKNNNFENKKISYKRVWKKIGGIYRIIDCVFTGWFLGSSPEQYICLEFYRKTLWERKQYLTTRHMSNHDKKSFQQYHLMFENE